MRTALLCLVLAGLFFSCDAADEPAPSGAAGLLPDLATYDWSLVRNSVGADSVTYTDTGTVRLRVADRDTSVPGYDGLTLLEVVMDATSSGGRSWAWYEPGDILLRDIAFASVTGGPVVAPRGGWAPVSAVDVYGLPHVVAEQMQAAARSAVDDSVIVRTDPRVVYKLPLEVGAAWVSFTDPFESTREVVGRETVTVAAGTFDCFVIQTGVGAVFDTETFEWLDYVAPEYGLVLRTVEFVGERRDGDGTLLETVRTLERLERTPIN